jgi:hypothetical protein
MSGRGDRGRNHPLTRHCSQFRDQYARMYAHASSIPKVVLRSLRISADLAEQRVALDPLGHWRPGEVETRQHTLDALPLELAPDRLPERRVGGLHLGQIVHWQAHAPMRLGLWLWHHRSPSRPGAQDPDDADDTSGGVIRQDHLVISVSVRSFSGQVARFRKQREVGVDLQPPLMSRPAAHSGHPPAAGCNRLRISIVGSLDR